MLNLYLSLALGPTFAHIPSPKMMELHGPLLIYRCCKKILYEYVPQPTTLSPKVLCSLLKYLDAYK